MSKHLVGVGLRRILSTVAMVGLTSLVTMGFASTASAASRAGDAASGDGTISNALPSNPHAAHQAPAAASSTRATSRSLVSRGAPERSSGVMRASSRAGSFAGGARVRSAPVQQNRRPAIARGSRTR
jgi:hypothetical protein